MHKSKSLPGRRSGEPWTGKASSKREEWARKSGEGTAKEELSGTSRDLPDISIVMTARDAERYLAEAIESIFGQQTTRTWELLFVDDGSEDCSLSLARRYAVQSSGRIRVLRHPGGVNRGISASRNLGLRYARGALLAFLDADDVWLPHHLDTLAAMLERQPRVAMVYAEAERWVDPSLPFDEAAARSAYWGANYLPPLVPTGERSGLLPRGRLLQWFRKDESLVPCICALMVRTAAARAVGGFCDAFEGLYDDQAFHAKIVLDHDVYALETCVARYRQHAGSCCGRHREEREGGRKERLQFEQFLRTYRDGREVIRQAGAPRTWSC